MQLCIKFSVKRNMHVAVKLTRGNQKKSMALLWLQVWTRIQYARAVIASGPHHIDALAIATCVAQRQAAAALPLN